MSAICDAAWQRRSGRDSGNRRLQICRVTAAAAPTNRRLCRRRNTRVIGVTRTAVPLAMLGLLAGCGPDYSPNTYSSVAVQQANPVERGEIIGARPIQVSADGVAGAATGAAAGGALGGVAGSQSPGGGVGTALGAIGGGLVGGLIGTSVEHVTSDTTAYEYIVQEPDKKLVSVTQKDVVPLKIGTRVLVIAGKQARIVPDYTAEPDAPRPAAANAEAASAVPKPAADAAEAKPADAMPADAKPADATAPANAAQAEPAQRTPPSSALGTAVPAPGPAAGPAPAPAPVAAAPLPAPVQ